MPKSVDLAAFAWKPICVHAVSNRDRTAMRTYEMRDEESIIRIAYRVPDGIVDERVCLRDEQKVAPMFRRYLVCTVHNQGGD